MDTETNRRVGHTPGPWMMDEHDKLNSARAFGIVRDIGTETDEPDSPRMTEVIAEVCAGPTAEADARLIAAAPMLFDTLFAVSERRRQWREDDDYSSIDYMDDMDRLDLDSALAAAGDIAAGAAGQAPRDRLSALTAALQLAKEHITKLANTRDECWRDWPGAYEVDAALGIND